MSSNTIFGCLLLYCRTKLFEDITVNPIRDSHLVDTVSAKPICSCSILTFSQIVLGEVPLIFLI